VRVLGGFETLNQSLEKVQRVADFFELAELMCRDALHRTESCGGHFREESQTPDGEALRDDEHFTYVAAWGFNGVGEPPTLVKEPLVFETVHPTVRDYTGGLKPGHDEHAVDADQIAAAVRDRKLLLEEVES
jgi:succinate dehydrogenase / fumarate reductase, flavoprotein subunit